MSDLYSLDARANDFWEKWRGAKAKLYAATTWIEQHLLGKNLPGLAACKSMVSYTIAAKQNMSILLRLVHLYISNRAQSNFESDTEKSVERTS